MQTRGVLFHILFLLVFLTGCQSDKEAEINNGKVSILSDGEIVRLDGYWDFTPNQLINPTDYVSESELTKKKMKVPSYWEEGTNYGTYHLILQFPEDKIGELQAFYLPQVYSAYKVWIDEELLVENGEVGTTPETMVPMGIPKVVYFPISKQEIHILMQVSNFHYRKSGISGRVYFGDPVKIERKIVADTTIKWLSVGAFIIMGLSQFILYLNRRKDQVSLYFAIFCLLFGLRDLFIGEASLHYFFPYLKWDIGLKLNFIILFTCAILFTKYFTLLFEKESIRSPSKLVNVLSILSIVIVIFTNGQILTNTVFILYLILMIITPYILILILRGIKRNRPGAKFIGFTFIVLMGTFINDLLFDAQIIDSVILSRLGMFLFIGAQSFLVSERFASTLKENEVLSSELEITQKEILFTLGEITETRSKETGHHVRRVANYAELLALKFGLSKEEAELIKAAAPLHDVGKIAIPDAILKKPGKLTDKEYELMKTHTTIGYEMLKHSHQKVLNTAAIIALTHHERYDGSGYPEGLKGNDIPLCGRITAISDVFDALSNDRVYKKAWDMESIRDYFRNERGKQFDPILVDYFLESYSEFVKIKETYTD